MKDLECVVICPKCRTEKFRVYRVKVSEGVYRNECEPPARKECETCGTALTRMA